MMVPDPSTPWDPPIPFIEVVTGRVVEYMATKDGTAGQRPLNARRRLLPQPQLSLADGGQRTAEALAAQVRQDRTGVSLTGNGAFGVACRQGRARMSEERLS